MKKIHNITSYSINKGVFKEKNLDNFPNMYDGNNTSIQLKWDVVKEAKSYAIFMIDFEGSNVFATPFIHWSVTNIFDNFLDENASLKNKQIIQGQNSLESKILALNFNPKLKWKYLGPAPKDTSHNYEIIIFALNKNEIKMKAGFNIYSFLKFNKSKIIGIGRKTFLASHPLKKNEKYIEFYKHFKNKSQLELSLSSFKKNNINEILKNINIGCSKKSFFTIVILNYSYIQGNLAMPTIEFIVTNLKNSHLNNLLSKEAKKLQAKPSKLPILSTLYEKPLKDSIIEIRVFQHEKILVEKNSFFRNIYRKLHGKVISEESLFL